MNLITIEMLHVDILGRHSSKSRAMSGGPLIHILTLIVVRTMVGCMAAIVVNYSTRRQ